MREVFLYPMVDPQDKSIHLNYHSFTVNPDLEGHAVFLNKTTKVLSELPPQAQSLITKAVERNGPYNSSFFLSHGAEKKILEGVQSNFFEWVCFFHIKNTELSGNSILTHPEDMKWLKGIAGPGYPDGFVFEPNNGRAHLRKMHEYKFRLNNKKQNKRKHEQRGNLIDGVVTRKIKLNSNGIIPRMRELFKRKYPHLPGVIRIDETVGVSFWYPEDARVPLDGVNRLVPVTTTMIRDTALAFREDIYDLVGNGYIMDHFPKGTNLLREDVESLDFMRRFG